MGAEFNWWLLIVGLVGGGALTWLVIADSTRREREIDDRERAAEASWIARTVDSPRLDAELAEEVLRAHRRYLGFPPPDVLVAPDEIAGLEAHGASAEPPSSPVGEGDEADEADKADAIAERTPPAAEPAGAHEDAPPA